MSIDYPRPRLEGAGVVPPGSRRWSAIEIKSFHSLNHGMGLEKFGAGDTWTRRIVIARSARSDKTAFGRFGTGSKAVFTDALYWLWATAGVKDLAADVAVIDRTHLKVGRSRFELKWDESGQQVLEDPSGRQYRQGTPWRRLWASAGGHGSVLHPLTAVEAAMGLEDVDPLASPQARLGGKAGRLIQRAVARLNRQIQRSSEQLTSASLWLRVIRAAGSILRQLLGLQRRSHAETPEAVTHSHTVDQYRTRGPNFARKTPFIPMVFREPMPA